MKKIFAISDIHGHYKEMREALDKAEEGKILKFMSI